MLFDLHGDIWTDVTAKRRMGFKNIIKNYHLERFKEGSMVGGIFVIWTDFFQGENPKERFIENIKAMNIELLENREILKVIFSTGDFYQAVKENKLAILLGLEGLAAIGEDVETIYTLYQLGFRHASLTWNEQNALATGVKGDANRGITTLGKDAVKIIEELGMILDVSHANEKTFWDIFEIAEKPFIASHSNSRAICDVPRNLTDHQIKAIGEKDGLIGVNAFHEFVHMDNERKTLDYFINHIEHIASLIGIDHVALGFDFFEYIEDEVTNNFREGPNVGTLEIEDISKGNNLISKLRERGFSREDIERISYKNFLNLMDKVL